MPIDNVDFLKKYAYNNYFVETGTFVGATVQLALDAGFKYIKSVELSPENYWNCVFKFKDNKNVNLYFGESEKLFWDMIKNIEEPITFFLDSHYSGVTDYYTTAKGRTYSSLVSELVTIAKHPIRNHTILIDDIRDLGTINMDFIPMEDVLQLIENINPDYNISFDTGDSSQHLFIDDILVAIIKQ